MVHRIRLALFAFSSLTASVLVPEELYFTNGGVAALTTDGAVRTWGTSDRGGDSSSVAQYLTSGVVSITSSGRAFAALKSDGQVVVWGHVNYGGDPTGEGVAPAALESGATKVVAGDYFFAVLKADGTVVSWGNILNGGTDGVTFASVEASLTNVVDLAAGTFAVCALKSDGSIVTWGLGNFHGATLENGAGPVVISGPVASVANTDRGFAALMVDGSVTTWGSGEDGGQVSTAVANELTGNVISVHSFHKFIHGSHGRSQHFIARKSDGTTLLWGGAFEHSFGLILQNVGPDTSDFAFGCQDYSRCGLAVRFNDGTVQTYGSSTNGGAESTNNPSELMNVQQLTNTGYSFAVLRSDGSVYAWGHQYSGGRGSDMGSAASSLESNVTKIYGNRWAFAALKNDGSVVAWGDTSRGGSLDGASVSADVVKVWSTWKWGTDGGAFFAKKADGSLESWGTSSYMVPAGIWTTVTTSTSSTHTVTTSTSSTATFTTSTSSTATTTSTSSTSSSSTSTSSTTATSSSSSSSSTSSTSSTSSSSTSTSSTSSSSSSTSSTSSSSTSTSRSSTSSSSTSSTSTSTSSTSTSSSSTSSTTSSSTSSSSTSTSSTSNSTTTSTTTTTSSTSTSTSSSTSTSTSSTTSSTSTSSTSTSSTSTSSTSSTSNSTTTSSTTSTSETSTSTSATSTSTTTSTASRTTSTSSTATSSTSGTTTVTTGDVPVYSRLELREMEERRKERAAQAVQAVEAVEASEVQELAALLEVEPSNASESPGLLLEVELEADVGEMKIVGLSAESLAAAGGRAIIVAGSASLEVTEEHLRQISADGPVFLSLLLMAEHVAVALATDNVLVESRLRSRPLSINFWTLSGQRMDVAHMAAMNISMRVQHPNATCAFWHEEDAVWSQEGVTTLAFESSVLRCSTTHLTIFGGVLDVVLKNVVLALSCSTFSTLMDSKAFGRLASVAWLGRPAFLFNIAVWVAFLVALGLSLRWDMSATVDKEIFFKSGEKQKGKSMRDRLRKQVSRAEVKKARGSMVHRCISMLQAHESGISKDSLVMISKVRAGLTQEDLDPKQEEKRAKDDAADIVEEIISLAASSESAHDRSAPAPVAPPRASIQTRASNALRQLWPNLVNSMHDRASQHGASAAERFLQSNLARRILILVPAAHPWAGILHFSLVLPYTSRVAQYMMKLLSAGSLGALFFSTSAPTPDSDPECGQAPDAVTQLLQAATVGLVTSLLGDVLILCISLVQRRKVTVRSEWTEEMKRKERFRLRVKDSLFWIFTVLYCTACQIYIFLFLANVRELDSMHWIESSAFALLEDLVVKPLIIAAMLGLLASLALCCWPEVKGEVQEQWMKSEETLFEVRQSSEDASKEAIEAPATSLPQLPDEEQAALSVQPEPARRPPAPVRQAPAAPGEDFSDVLPGVPH